MLWPTTRETTREMLGYKKINNPLSLGSSVILTTMCVGEAPIPLRRAVWILTAKTRERILTAHARKDAEKPASRRRLSALSLSDHSNHSRH